jgi:hypothetical protein
MPCTQNRRRLRTHNSDPPRYDSKPVSRARPAADPKPIEIVTAARKPDSPWPKGGFRARGRKWAKQICTWSRYGWGAPSKSFRAVGGLREHRSRETLRACPGGHMDSNTIFTSLFGGCLKAADKAAAAAINYSKSTVIPGVCNLSRKATLATGYTLVYVGSKLTDCCTDK